MLNRCPHISISMVQNCPHAVSLNKFTIFVCPVLKIQVQISNTAVLYMLGRYPNLSRNHNSMTLVKFKGVHYCRCPIIPGGVNARDYCIKHQYEISYIIYNSFFNTKQYGTSDAQNLLFSKQKATEYVELDKF